MKKIILILTILILTGCFGEVGKGYITKTCTKEENINNIKVNTNIEIKSKEGNVENITITEVFDTNDLTSITNSKKSEKNLYQQTTGIILEINNNTFTYKIDVLEASDLIKERFNIKEETHKQISFYEENGYICK